jgi:TonB family protein
MTLNRNLLGSILALLAFTLTAAQVRSTPSQEQASQQKSAERSDDRALAAALCPIVYQVDHFPSPHGYRYIFYGNGFFVNKDGYLLTAAHVLSQLRGGQPFLLLRSPGAPPQFVQATVVAIDRDHDIALLLATPNPFAGKFTVSFLPLDHDNLEPGRSVLAADSRPVKPRDAYTLDPVIEARSAGEVLGYEFSQLAKGPVDTELFLFGHAVEPGQSGAPVISLDSEKVVGLVEGQWLRENMTALAAPSRAAPIPGAVIPIHYAIALLQQKDVAWQATPEGTSGNEGVGGGAELSSVPTPLSLVPSPYPQSLFGGEVVLDALVGRAGTLLGVKVVHGDEPFLNKALAAVRTWTFLPGHATDARISITFQFTQPYVPPRSPMMHHYDEDSRALEQGGAARPLKTVEAAYPAASNAEGSVILYESIDRDGKLSSVQVMRGLEPLTDAAALDAAHQWQFAPAMHSGTAIDSAAIVVFTFRHPLATSPAMK